MSLHTNCNVIRSDQNVFSQLGNWFQNLFSNTFFGSVRSKHQVNPVNSMTLAAVYYARSRISGNVGTLPLNTLQKMEEFGSTGANKLTGHSSWNLFRVAPNDYQTPIVFQQQIQDDALGWGNGRAFIVRGGTGRPIELLPLRPDRTVTFLHHGEKVHCTRPLKDDQLSAMESIADAVRTGHGETVIAIPDRDVFHIQNLGNGVVGKSTVLCAQESMFIGLRAQDNMANQINRGFAGSLMLNAPPGTFRDEADAIAFLSEFRTSHGSDKDAEVIGMLRDGVTATVQSMSNKDAQFIELNQFNRQDVGLWFGIEAMPYDNASVSYNSLEMKNLAYLTNCLMPWLVKWEQEANAKLLTTAERRARIFHKFNFATMLRADMKTTMETISLAIQNRVRNPNEGRELLDLNPYDGGQVYENPNISPGASSTSGSNGTETPQAKLEHLFRVEQKKTLPLLESGDKKEISRFMATWAGILRGEFENLGGTRAMAMEHCICAESSPKYDVKLRALHVISQIEKENQ